MRRPFLGRFDIMKSLSTQPSSRFQTILKMLKSIPIVFAMQFLITNPALAATEAGLAATSTPTNLNIFNFVFQNM